MRIDTAQTVIVEVAPQDIKSDEDSQLLIEKAFHVGAATIRRCTDVVERRSSAATFKWKCGLGVAVEAMNPENNGCRVAYMCAHEDCPLGALKAAHWFVATTHMDKSIVEHPIAAA